MRLAGRATKEGTEAHLRANEPWVRSLGSTGLRVGAVGFGTYRLDQGDPGHEAALRAALNGGDINLIDTACNYTGGQSEMLIGQVLADEISSGRLHREGVVVVSKAGYLTDGLLGLAKDGDVPNSSVSKLGADHWHSFHPTVLDFAIKQSLDRLGLETIDVFLLHNPEYFLSSRKEEPIGSLRSDFYTRIGDAFECLEKWVSAGVIGSYGISSNTLGFSADDPTSTSVADCMTQAERVAGEEHHFRVVQCPVNLMEREPLKSLANSELAVLANRPLNAIDNRVVYRLAQEFSLNEALKFRERARALRRSEQTFRRVWMNNCTTVDTRRIYVVNELAHGLARFPSRVSLSDYMTYTHWPQLRRIFSELDTRLQGDAEFHAWRTEYWNSLSAFVQSAMAQLEQRDWETIGPLVKTLESELPPSLREASLAQKAWWFSGSRPGVTTVLAGARQPEYVQEIHSLAERWDQ